MARQIGIIKIKGSIGDLSFYESGGMQLVRKKTGATKKQIEADPRFEQISGSYFPVAKGKYNAMLFDKIYC